MSQRERRQEEMKKREGKKEGKDKGKTKNERKMNKAEKTAQFPSERVVLWHLNPNSLGVKIKKRYLSWTHWFVKTRKIQKWAPKN